MTGPDLAILNFLNSHVGQFPNFDAGVVHLAMSHLFKMTPMVLLLWGFWFVRDDATAQRRAQVALAFIGAFVAMSTTRALTYLLPFRLRPIHNPDIVVQVPYPMDRHLLDGWSSLPSDHAGLAFALAVGVFLIHRRWGILMLLHAAILVCLPRAYLGFHYASDLLAGALAGTLCAWLTMRVLPLEPVISRIMRFERLRPALFYVLFFLWPPKCSRCSKALAASRTMCCAPWAESPSSACLTYRTTAIDPACTMGVNSVETNRYITIL